MLLGKPVARILVVDDDPAIREAAALSLEKAGHSVVRTGSLAAAREALQREAFAVVLCDIYFPGESGMELLRELAGLPHPR